MHKKQSYKHMRHVHDAIDLATGGFYRGDGATLEFIVLQTKLSRTDAQWALTQLVFERVVRAWRNEDGRMLYASREETD